jgi:hypothetical protein
MPSEYRCHSAARSGSTTTGPFNGTYVLIRNSYAMLTDRLPKTTRLRAEYLISDQFCSLDLPGDDRLGMLAGAGWSPAGASSMEPVRTA